jgi:tRNA(Arg) A34 adenosine deaminase TadA
VTRGLCGNTASGGKQSSPNHKVRVSFLLADGMQRSETLTISLPAWVTERVEWDRSYRTDTERMQLAVQLARENVLRGDGGPFGAAVFEAESGRVVSAGVNLVTQLNNCLLHGETVALMLAQARVRSYTLDAPGLPAHELVTSCEPCAMCLGATLWSGVRRVVWGASREDAERLGFDEGPVFPQSYAYLIARGITFTAEVLREEARAVLELYREQGGPIYGR